MFRRQMPRARSYALSITYVITESPLTFNIMAMLNVFFFSFSTRLKAYTERTEFKCNKDAICLKLFIMAESLVEQRFVNEFSWLWFVHHIRGSQTVGWSLVRLHVSKHVNVLVNAKPREKRAVFVVNKLRSMTSYSEGLTSPTKESVP